MSFKDRLERAVPVWRQILQRSTPFIRKTVVAGGAAGAITVAAIKKGDQLVSVIENAAGTLTDRTAEFVVNTDAGQIVRADGSISNAGGTATTGDQLIVEWLAWAE